MDEKQLLENYFKLTPEQHREIFKINRWGMPTYETLVLMQPIVAAYIHSLPPQALEAHSAAAGGEGSGEA